MFCEGDKGVYSAAKKDQKTLYSQAEGATEAILDRATKHDGRN